MGLKILHSADWHLDSPFAGFSPEQRAYLREELRKIPGKIADLCLRESCDLVLLSGDLFDGPYSRESAAEVYTALERCAVPVMIAPGNHDYLTAGSPWLEEKWPDNVFIFTGNLTGVSLPELDCRVYGAGYRGMESPGLLEGFRAQGNEKYQIAVLHGDPMRLQSPYCPVTAAQVRDSGLAYVALGHIHKAGSFHARNSLCGWPGAPMGRGWDETREKGVYIVEMDERAAIRFVPLNTPRFFDLEVNTDESDLADALPGVPDQHFYRVVLTGSGGEPLRELKRRCAGFVNLELIDRRDRAFDPWERAGEDTLEGIYFRLLREKLERADPETAAYILQAAEISAKILEDREVVF